MPFPKYPGIEPARLSQIDADKEIRLQALHDASLLSGSSEDSFQKGKTIGKGSFGEVFEAMNESTGEIVAIKMIRLQQHKPQQAQIDLINTEIALLRKLRHPHIVRIKGSWDDGEAFFILMELVAGRSLAEILVIMGALHENVTRKFTRQLLQALNYMHRQGCVHRDLKGKNILMTTTGQLKLCDFGSALMREFRDGTYDKDLVKDGYSYTPLWVAPETITHSGYNEKVDVWSLGCCVIEMSSGKDPWSERGWTHPNQAVLVIGGTKELPRIPEGLSEEGKDFVRACLTRDPAKRPSMAELLKHPFVRDPTHSAAEPGDPSATITLSNSAQEQMNQMQHLVDTKVKTMEIGAGAGAGAGGNDHAAAAASPTMVVFKPTRKSLPPLPPTPTQAPASAAGSGSFPSPPPPPFPFTHSASPQAVLPSNLTVQSGAAAAAGAGAFNMVYSFHTTKDANGEIVAAGAGGGDSHREVSMSGSGSEPGSGLSGSSSSVSYNSDTVRSGSRIFQYEPSASWDVDDADRANFKVRQCDLAAGAGGGVGGDVSMSSTVISFHEGYDSLNLNLQPTV